MKGQPFFFDSNIFDDDSQLSEEELAAQPEFTRGEMEQAKASSFEEGKRAGFKDSEENITNQMLGILQKIESDMGILFAAEDNRNKTYEAEALHLSATIFTKAFPQYMETHGQDELKVSITSALSDQITPTKIQIELNKTLHTALSGFLKDQENTLQKQVTLVADDTLSDNNCRISWPEGGLICNRENTAKKIFEILNRSLAERGISLHDGEQQQEAEETQMSEETNTSGDS